MIYFELFLSFFQVGAFSIGGGYVALPLIQNQVVDIHGWLTLTEFTDLITISQMTPGPIAINSATFVGTRIAGLPGAIIATLGCILPSCIIVSLLAYLYFKYTDILVIKEILGVLRPAIVALIASAGLTILILSFWNGNEFSTHLNKIDFIAVGVFALAIMLLRKFKLNPIYVMLIAGVIGGLFNLY